MKTAAAAIADIGKDLLQRIAIGGESGQRDGIGSRSFDDEFGSQGRWRAPVESGYPEVLLELEISPQGISVHR